jgi:hypothetical protein
MELSLPSSTIEIELVKKKNKKMRFKRIFVALKPCVDGFIAGCRPYVGIDATKLTSKYSGQFASAAGADGHNRLYHLEFAIFESETKKN